MHLYDAGETERKIQLRMHVLTKPELTEHYNCTIMWEQATYYECVCVCMFRKMSHINIIMNIIIQEVHLNEIHLRSLLPTYKRGSLGK